MTPPGYATEVWAPRLAAAPMVTLPGLLGTVGVCVPDAGLVVVGAHPDDESLGCGRLMSLWRRHAGEVNAVVATAGEACIDHIQARPAGLAERRLVEWHAAMDDLGVGARRCAHIPDGQVGEHHDELCEIIRHQISTQPGPVVLAVTWRHDPHPDHRACGRAAAAVAAEQGIAMIEFPVWATFWLDPESAEARSAQVLRVKSDETADAEHALACRRYLSQLQPLGPDLAAVVPPEMLEHHTRQLVLHQPLNAREIGSATDRSPR